MMRPAARRLLFVVSVSLLAWPAAQARPLSVGGEVQSAALSSRELSSGEGLAVWTLPRLGVAVRNDPKDLRLLYGGRELRWAPGRGWQAVGFAAGAALPAPEQVGQSLYVGLDILRALGVPLSVTPQAVEVAAPRAVPAGTLPPSPASAPGQNPGAASTATHTLSSVRQSVSRQRTVELQRTVLELQGSGEAFYQVQQRGGAVSLSLPYTRSAARSEILDGGAVLLVTPAGSGSQLDLLTGGGQTRIFTLQNPTRIVLDTVVYRDRSQTPPVATELLPQGVRYRQQGGLSLLSFDPSRYRPRVVSAPWGQRTGLAALVRSAGGVAGINGGYFDMQSGKPVDLVAQGGVMRIGSLQKRATLGFTPAGEVLLGYPAPRYVAEVGGQRLLVNQMTPLPRPELLTAWAGDGRTVGAAGLVTLTVRPGTDQVLTAQSGTVTTQPGNLHLTFDPARFPALPRTAGAPLSLRLEWNASDAPWPSSEDALSAGPLLLRGGQSVLNPQREGFDTAGSIWRATHQTAFGLLGGWPTFAYLERGTPEQLLVALRTAGLSDAVRMDSGGSSAVYLSGGYADLGGYLNPAWSRDIPNAVVMVPR
ncbi:hypothetical protein GCM10017783_20810 [Deinococcus piscis]|uniref:Phosphodiester glycosidase domain-containing protein n=1 Tax=Deinococcus piscis TaxID=394230 RepID=A0ABQ3K860_9DEIO|nr:phosphodiester glycosidase family protein [Deinococcus piscis]GHG08072.1 hypothetical protein GCM10017783_20810 [Deinococcus piscis]